MLAELMAGDEPHVTGRVTAREAKQGIGACIVSERPDQGVSRRRRP